MGALNSFAIDLAREHEDPWAAQTPPLTLDRQRVVHSTAFRRLQYKTQVFVAFESDHFRTRLTHTLEVAHVARCLAAALGLNADLAEVAALAHDLGHPPFGHAGERVLDECMRDHGGFEHNVQSLRVVEYLEHPYPPFRGLNLTRCVRGCLAKHATEYDRPRPHPLQDGRPPPPEGLAAAMADQLAYALHDLQDGLFAGLIDPGELSAVELWELAYTGPRSESPAWRGHIRPALDRMQAMLIDDVVRESGSPGGADDPDLQSVRMSTISGVRFSPAMRQRFSQLGAFLLAHVYRNQRLVRADSKARRIVAALFDAYVAEPGLLPRRYVERVAEQGAARVAADYIAGMTDRFCLEEHARLFDPRVSDAWPSS